MGSKSQMSKHVPRGLRSMVQRSYGRKRKDAETLFGLPDEIWSSIWKALPIPGLVAVTHVCHTWRTLALGDPTVWPTNLDFRIPNAWRAPEHPSVWPTTPDYRLRIYNGGGRSANPPCTVCAACPEPHSSRTTAGYNWDLLRAVLLRSSPQPLTLAIDVCPDHIQTPLAQLLMDVADRLVSLCVRGAGNLMGNVLPALHLAPVLRSLSLVGSYMPEILQLPSDVHLPALEELNLDLPPGLFWPPPASSTVVQPHRLYSKLRSASIVVTNFPDILSILDVCPGIRELTVANIGGAFRWAEVVKPQGHFPAALTIGASVGPTFFQVMAALQDDYFPDVTVHYGMRSIVAHIDMIPFFCALRGTTTLSITRVAGTEESILLAAQAENGLRRATITRYTCLMMMHGMTPIDVYIPHSTIVAATVDLPLWPQLTGGISILGPPAHFPLLARLTIVLCPADGLNQRFQPAHATTSFAFPAMTTLRVEGLDTPAGLAIFSTQWLANFVARLGLTRYLEKIELPWCSPQTLDVIRSLGLADSVE